MLTEFDREVLLRLAAEDAAAAGATPPFRLRPGLLAAMLAFYDELRRRGRTIDALDRNIGDKLEAGRDSDRGAERLLQQTQLPGRRVRGVRAPDRRQRPDRRARSAGASCWSDSLPVPLPPSS